MCYYNPLHRSRRFINQYFRLTDLNAKLFTRNHDMCFAEKSARMRPSAAWRRDLNTNWRQCVWLTCPTPTHDKLASRCSKRTARKLPRCGTGARAKNTYCDLSSFGPALFEIWWPDIYLGGPYGPVKDKMYWPELVRQSEKCAGPAGQYLCRGLVRVVLVLLLLPILILWAQGTFCSVSRRESRCKLRRSLINNKNTSEKSRIIVLILLTLLVCHLLAPRGGRLVGNKSGHSYSFNFT